MSALGDGMQGGVSNDARYNRALHARVRGTIAAMTGPLRRARGGILTRNCVLAAPGPAGEVWKVAVLLFGDAASCVENEMVDCIGPVVDFGTRLEGKQVMPKLVFAASGGCQYVRTSDAPPEISQGEWGYLRRSDAEIRTEAEGEFPDSIGLWAAMCEAREKFGVIRNNVKAYPEKKDCESVVHYFRTPDGRRVGWSITLFSTTAFPRGGRKTVAIFADAWNGKKPVKPAKAYVAPEVAPEVVRAKHYGGMFMSLSGRIAWMGGIRFEDREQFLDIGVAVSDFPALIGVTLQGLDDTCAADKHGFIFTEGEVQQFGLSADGKRPALKINAFRPRFAFTLETTTGEQKI